MILNECVDLHLSCEIFYKVVNHIDQVFTDGITKCYTSFCEINEPIVSRKDIDDMIQSYIKNLPDHHKTMREIMCIDQKEKKTKNQHLLDQNFYNKSIFYQFLSQSRVMNCPNLCNWACITAIANYARGVTDNRQSSHKYFGSSVSRSTMNRVLEKIKTENSDTFPKLLAKEKIIFTTMDNNQKGFNVKIPRHGINNIFIKVTGRLFIQCDETLMNGLEDVRVAITYTNQVIPSVLNQPHFENCIGPDGMLDTTISDVISNFDKVSNSGLPIDITGKRVQSYIDLVDICHTIICEQRFMSGYNWTSGEFKRWNHQPQHYYDNVTRQASVKVISKLKNNFISLAKKFQRRHTHTWNTKSGKATKLFIPAVSTYDEMKLNEYGMALIEVMTMCGLLVDKTKIDSTGKKKPKWNIAEDYEERTMYLCMDGLSLDRHRSLEKRLASLPLSYVDAFEQSLDFQKALSRIIEIPGPLHIAFHMCQCIFNIYTPFLSVLQSILQWKR